jgi:hypothetical protein
MGAKCKPLNSRSSTRSFRGRGSSHLAEVLICLTIKILLKGHSKKIGRYL